MNERIDTRDDDTEGHMPRIRIVEEASEHDTVAAASPAETDGAEGHGLRRARLEDADGDGDVEGHRAATKR